MAYDFIGIKGGNGKMSSSTGNVLTLTDLLRVYDKNLILWFYAKNKPNHQFNIALDDDVLRAYAEYDRMVNAYFEGKLDDKNASVLSLTDVNASYLNNPNFGYIANFLPMVSYNEDSLTKLLSKENIDCSTIYFKNRLLRARCWLEKYNNSKINVLEEFNQEFYDTLTDEEKEWLKMTLSVLKNEYASTQDLQNDLYAIVKTGNDDSKELKARQKRYFQIIYNLILGQSSGPKMGLLLSAMDYELIASKLQKVKTKKLTKNY